MKYTLSVITILVSLVIMNSCQEGDQETSTPQIDQVFSSAFQQSSPVNQQVYLKFSEVLEVNPIESLIEPEFDYHGWIQEQESIEDSTKQQLLSISNGVSSVVMYNYNLEIDAWDVYLFTARDNGEAQITLGDPLAVDAINYELLGSGEKSPTHVLFKKKKKKPINVDEKGCTKRVCDGGHCHEITFVPCRLSKGMASCSVLGSACGSTSGDGVLGGVHGGIITFEF